MKNIKIDIIESKTLIVGVFVNLIMAITGWITFYFSNSDAVLLDGNFSFIAAITTFFGIIISKKKHIRTSDFPFGNYVFESFFVFFKGIMILGITIVASIQSSVKIINFLKGKSINPIDIHSIFYYIIIVIILCFGLAFYYKARNKQIKNKSSMLSVESKSSLIDGFLSLGLGIFLITISIIPTDSTFHFLLYIGDAIIVLILSMFLAKIPIKIIKTAFIELRGGVLQDKKSRVQIEEVISKNLSSNFINNSNYITKLGSSYLVVVYVNPKTDLVNVNEIERMKEEILNSLIPDFHTVYLEIVINKNEKSQQHT